MVEKRVLVLCLCLLSVAAQRGMAQIDERLERLDSARGTTRDAAMIEIARDGDAAAIAAVLDAAKGMSFEVTRRAATALGRNARALGILARALLRDDQAAALAARALDEHFVAHSMPLPEDPDAIQVLPEHGFDLTGIADLEDFCDVLLGSRALRIPVVLEPSLALSAGPAKLPFPGRGAYPLRFILPPLDAAVGAPATSGSLVLVPLVTNMDARAFVVRDDRGPRTLASSFVRSLAYFTSPRAPDKLRQRAAITLGSLELATLEEFFRTEMQQPETRDAAIVGLAVRFLRGVDAQLSQEVASAALELFRAVDAPRQVVGAALRLHFEQSLAAGRSDFLRGDDAAVAALMAGVHAQGCEERIDANIAQALARRDEGAIFLAECWMRAARFTAAPLDRDLLTNLQQALAREDVGGRFVDAVLGLLDRRGRGAAAALPDGQRWNEDSQLGAAWGRSLARAARIEDAFVLLGRVQELGPGGSALVEALLDTPQSADLVLDARFGLAPAVRDEVLAYIDPIDAAQRDQMGEAARRVRTRLMAQVGQPVAAAERSRLARTYGRLLVGASQNGAFDGKGLVSHVVELLQRGQTIEVFEAVFAALVRSEPRLARDLVVEVAGRRDLDPALRMRLPEVHARVTNELPGGQRLVDPFDPMRRAVSLR